MNSSARKLFKNIIANQAGFLVSVVVTFFLSPFVVNSLGSTRYGIWSLIVSLTGNYGLLAFGIQGAMTRYIAHAAATNDRERVNGYFNTALSFLLFSAALTIVIGLSISLFIDRIFVLPGNLLQDARSACVLVTFSAVATFAFAAFDSFLVAHQQFQLTNAVGTFTTLVRAGMTVWILKQGYGIVALAALGTVLTFLNGFLEVAIAMRRYLWLKVSPSSATISCLKELINYAYKSFIVGISVALIYQVDILVIGGYLPPSNITTYSLASTLIIYLVQMVSSIQATFNPYTTELFAKSKMDQLRKLVIQGSCLMYMFGGLCVSGLVVLGESFFILWVGRDYANSSIILSILAIPQFFAIGSRIGCSTLVGMARVGPLAIASICEGISNLVLSLILVHYFSILGVAIGTMIPAIINYGFWTPIYISRVIGVKYKLFFVRSILPGFVVCLITLGLNIIVQKNIIIRTWTMFFSNVIIDIILGFVLMINAYCIFNKEVKFRIMSIKQIL